MKVLHILYDGSIEENTKTEQRLLEKFISIEEIYYPSDLLGYRKPSEEKNLLDRAYKEANKKIGYRTGDEEE